MCRNRNPAGPWLRGKFVIQRIVLLVVSALALSLLFGANNPVSAPAPTSTVPPLPPTQPGLSRDEGVFLVTTADDGSQLIYFIAGNTRHNVSASDLSLELQQNPLWPVRQAALEYVKWFAEGGPIGTGQPGLLNGAAAPAAESTNAKSAADTARTYTVVPGDSAFKIARQFGIDEEALLEANDISNASRVYVGQVLTSPATSS